MTVTIEEGKFYRTRDGRKVGPMQTDGEWWFGKDDEINRTYLINGDWSCRGEETKYDLVAEWHDHDFGRLSGICRYCGQHARANTFCPGETKPAHDDQARAAVESIVADDYLNSHLADGTPAEPLPEQFTNGDAVPTPEESVAFETIRYRTTYGADGGILAPDVEDDGFRTVDVGTGYFSPLMDDDAVPTPSVKAAQRIRIVKFTGGLTIGSEHDVVEVVPHGGHYDDACQYVVVHKGERHCVPESYAEVIPAIRTFSTGASRDQDVSKLDYEGFLSPVVLKAFAAYMHKNRRMADGSLRDSDNWQKGIPTDAYMKSMWRHFFNVWALHRGRGDLAGEDLNAALCGLLFNAMGYLHETNKPA